MRNKFTPSKIFAVAIIFISSLMLQFANAQTVTIGTNNGANGTTTYPCPIQDYYGGTRAQFLYTAAELNAQGITSGAVINQIGWVVNATAISSMVQEGYTLSLLNTSVSTLNVTAAWEPGATLVYGPTNYSYPSGFAGNVMFNTSSFTYTGGNLIVEMCAGAATTSFTTNPACQWTTGLPFNGSHQYRADNVQGCGNATITNSATATNRPLVVISYVPGFPCTAPPTPGAATASPSSGLCPGNTISLGLSGNSNGSGQTYQWQYASAIGGPYSNLGGATASPSINTPATFTLYYRCEVTCSSVPATSTPVLVTVNPAFPGGTYTINSAVVTGGTNFQTFNAFKNAIACGIAGPIIVNVDPVSGPYNEQVSFPAIGGTSAVNTITINGNGRTLTFAASLSTAPSTLELNGTDYMTINNLIVNGTGVSYALACHLWNQADNNAFNNCTFNVPANTTSTTCVPFSISGSQTSATTTGIAGNNNVITGCTMFSGYYNTCIVGNTAPQATGNQVINCNIRDQYFYGMYIYYQNGAIIRGNTVERPTRTTLSTFYGIYVTTGCINVQVDGNRIQNPYGAAPTNTGTAYGIYTPSSASLGNENIIKNNLIQSFNSSGPIYGIYMPSYTYNRFYHNTIAFDQITATGTTTTYGIYAYGNPTDIRNNIVTIRRGGTGTKYCLYLATPTGVTCNNNDLYINSAAGTNYIGYNGTSSYATLPLWQAGSGKDANSVSVDPLYISPGTGDYTPSNGLVNNIGANVGVTTDIIGTPRTIATPDPGAYEFTVGGLDAGISWVSPVSPSTTGLKTITVNIINTQTTVINSLNLSYNDGTGPVTESFTGLNILGGTNQNFSFTTQYNLLSSVTMTVSILSVNGGSDAISGNNTATYSLCIGLSGTYTINSAVATGGTNYQTFTAAVNALSCGIAGPVIFNLNVTSGPYNEQVAIPVVNGVSAVNTITFNGNGRTITFLGTVSAPHTFMLSGADYVTVNNLVIIGTDATYALACHLWNGSDNNTFSGCTFTCPANGTSTSQVPFSISGSPTSPTTSGVSGSNNLITGCTINSGYYNTVIYGNSVAPFNVNNQVVNCNINDFYLYGIYNVYCQNSTFSGNIIQRLTRTTLSTAYCIYMSTGSINCLAEKNRIRRLFDAAPTNTNTAYCMYNGSSGTLGNENKWYNNLVSDISSAGAIYGMYCPLYNFVKIYHNTISFDHAASTSTTSCYGMYAYGSSCEIRNNIITIRRGGTATKYGLYIPTPAGVSSNNNNIYLNAPAGTNYFGYNGSSSSLTLAAWQAANPTFDIVSTSVDPFYFNPAAGNYKPTSSIVDNGGAPLGVATDITGALRSPSTPDPGAYEFTVAAKDVGVFNIVSPAPTGCYTNAETFTVTIKNYGTQALDFSVDNVTVNCDITGPVNTTVSATLTSGTLAVGATQNVSLSPTVDGTANGTYTINAYTVMTSDGETGNDAFPLTSIPVGPVAGTISSSVSSICVSGSPVLSNTGVYGGAIQWQESTTSASGPWTNVGTSSATYAPGTITQTTYYQALTVCNANSSASNNVTVTVSTPVLTSTSAGTRCGLGTVTLGATASSGNTVSWFANSTGGTSLGTGNSFTTPVINSTATYYAEAGTGAGFLTGLGNTSVPPSSGFNAKRGIQFDAYQSFTLVSAQYYAAFTGTTNLTVELQNSAGTVLQTATLNIVHLSGSASWNTIPINFNIVPGTGYKLLCQFNTGSLSNYSHSSGANYALPAWNNLGSVGLITNGLDFGPVVSTTSYWYFYNITVSAGCASARTAVTATVTPPPSINVSTADDGVCAGNSTTVSVNSGNDPNYTYAWTSNPSGFTGSGAGPLTVSPTVTTKYIVTATDNTAGPNAGCVTKDSITVATGVALIAGSIAANQTQYCVSGSPSFTITGADGGAIRWQSSTVSASGPWTNVGTLNSLSYNAGTITQTTYYRARVYCQANEVFTNVITVNVNSPQLSNTAPDSRCGAGTVTLGATGASGATVNWYAAATGGTPIGTGNSFTTPVITSSTNFYASASSGGGTATVGNSAPVGPINGYGLVSYGDVFTVTSALTLNSVVVYPYYTTNNTSLSLTVGLYAASVVGSSLTQGALLQSATVNVIGNVTPTPQTINLNFAIPPGTYFIAPVTMTFSGTSALLFENPGTVMGYPYSASGISITGASYGATIYQTLYYYFYNWVVSTGCESARTAVLATVNPAPPINASATYLSPCAGNPTDLSVSSSNAGYIFTWTSSPAGFNQTGAGPFTVTPSVATTYTVTATDNSGGAYDGCGNIATLSIVPTANTMSIVASGSPPSLCPGQNVALTVNPAPTSGYCSISYANYDGTDYISNVTLNTINNTTGATALPGYANYTAISTTLTAGSTYSFSTTDGSYASNENMAAWIDYNQNGTFDASEQILANSVTAAAFQTFTTSFTVPSGAINGTTRLRVVDMYSITANSCATGSSYGETEDYTINIIGGVTHVFTYQWSGPGAYSSTSQSPNITNSAGPGTYVVTVTDGSTGCTKSATAATVNPPPDPNASSNAPICDGSSVFFFGDNFASGQTSGNSYSWTGPGGYSASGQFPILSGATLANSGTFTVTVTNLFGCTESASTSVVINPNPVLSTTSVTNASCIGAADGCIDVDASNGTPFYIFDYLGNSTLDGIYCGLGAGIHNVTVIDDNGCTSDLNVTVIEEDLVDPQITCPPDVTVNNTPNLCEGTAIFVDPTGTDNCVGAITSQTGGLTSGSSFPVGITPIEYTVTDAFLNTATCTFNVVVVDNENPTVTCPPDVTVNNTPNLCEGTAIFVGPTGTDNCAGAITSQSGGLTSGSSFPIGITPIEYTVTDAFLNTATCTFNVVVVDNENPTVTCPPDVTVFNTPNLCEGTAIFVGPTGTDNCAGAITSQSGGLASGSSFPVGITPIEYTVTDAFLNTATCTFNVVVVDNQNPTITCPPNVTVFNTPNLCEGTAIFVGPTGTDNCAGATTSQTGGLTSGSSFPVGISPIQYTVTDAFLNTATCTFNVIVIDNQNPTITCPADTVVNANAGVCYATLGSLGTPMTGDNCAVFGITTNAPAQFPVGATIVDWEVSDLVGNKATCQQFVIVQDMENPTISGMPSNITFTADPTDCTPSISWTAPTANDNCSISSLTPDYNPGDEFPEGTTTVTYTAIDINGNQVQSSFTVTVLAQPLLVAASSPTYQCGYNVSCNGSSNGGASATVSGGCLPYLYAWSNGETTQSASGLSAGTYTVTVTDDNGHVTVQSVTLTQPAALSSTLGPDQSYEFSCTCASLVPVTTGGAACQSYNYAWNTGASTSSLTVCPSQTANYTVTVTDANGCTTSDQIIIIKSPLVTNLDRYVVMGTGTATDNIGADYFITGGVGHRLATGSLNLQNNASVNTFAAGNNVILGNNSVVGTLYRNTATVGNNAFIGTTVTPVTIPLTTKVPCFPTFSGGANVNVASFTTATISPGTYNNIILGNQSTLKLNPGVYNVNSISTGNVSQIIPNGAATAKDIIVFVKTTVNVGNNNNMHGSYYAQGAMNLANGNNTTGTFIGAFLGKPVSTGNSLTFTLDAYCYSNLALCNSKVEGETAELETLTDKFSLFPNPSTGEITVQYVGETGHDINMSVLDVLGQVLYERTVYEFSGELQQSLDLKSLNQGVYFIQLHNGTEVVTKQFVITK